MTTAKAHINIGIIDTGFSVQEPREYSFQEDSGCFADARSSAALLFLKNDWKPTLGKRSLCFDPFAWVFRTVISCTAMFIYLTQTLHLDMCGLFPTFCNHGLYSSSSSPISRKLLLYFTFNIIFNWKGRVSQSYLPTIEKPKCNLHFNRKLANNILQFFRWNFSYKEKNYD